MTAADLFFVPEIRFDRFVFPPPPTRPFVTPLRTPRRATFRLAAASSCSTKKLGSIPSPPLLLNATIVGKMFTRQVESLAIVQRHCLLRGGAGRGGVRGVLLQKCRMKKHPSRSEVLISNQENTGGMNSKRPPPLAGAKTCISNKHIKSEHAAPGIRSASISAACS